SSGLADRAQGGRRQRRPVRRPRKGLRPRTGRAAFLRLARGRSAPPATTRPPRRPERRHGGQGGLEPSGRLGASIEHRRSLGHLLQTRRGREALNKKTRFHLTRGAALGAAIALGSLAASPALAEWRRAETEHFIVYGDASEGSLRRYAQKVERFDALLRTYYPVQTDHEIPKLEIFMAEGRRDMNRMSPGISEGVAGYYSPNSGRIYTIVDTRSSMGDVVVFHEYAHHFMFQMQANAYPS